MIDAVLGHHMNPLTCGVAKFNQQLAERLGVPYLPLESRSTCINPIVSIKMSEIPEGHYGLMPGRHRLLLHDRPHATFLGPSAIFYADEVGCPSTVRGNASRGSLNILSFGMAHKYQQTHWDRLKTLLDRTLESYTLSLSTAIHENTPWDVTFTENIALMRAVFGDHLRVLGFLADDALAKELREVQAVALFYEPAVRANNTSLWAALDAGTPVITNLDAQSPSELQHNVSVFDLKQLTEWPDAARCREVRMGGTKASEAYSWDRLIATLTAEVLA